MQFKTYITALAVFCSTAGASYSQEIQRDCQSSQNSYGVVYVNNDTEKDSIIELTSRDNLSFPRSSESLCREAQTWRGFAEATFLPPLAGVASV